MHTYYSEFGQDKYLNEQVFHKKERGVFLDVGAANGINLSNTYYFERFMHWTGLCIEPRKQTFNILQKNRTCICENICIANNAHGSEEFTEFTGNWLPLLSGLERNFYPEHQEKIREGLEQKYYKHQAFKYPVTSCKLQELLVKHALYEIDYCSIDTEGSELEILQSIDFSSASITAFSIENNYNNQEIESFMRRKGYDLACRIGKAQYALDEIYLKRSV